MGPEGDYEFESQDFYLFSTLNSYQVGRDHGDVSQHQHSSRSVVQARTTLQGVVPDVSYSRAGYLKKEFERIKVDASEIVDRDLWGKFQDVELLLRTLRCLLSKCDCFHRANVVLTLRKGLLSVLNRISLILGFMGG